MKIKTILKITGGQIINDIKEERKIRSIQIDTRKLSKNDLFIAIKGENLNGHDFIDSAISKGANAVIVEEDVLIETSIPIIRVNSTVKALGALAFHMRTKHKDIPLIAITGSTGKTTTKELIANILEKKYKVLKTDGSCNNHLGVPTTLLKLNSTYDLIVLELGMNHLKEIEYLSNLCLPNYGIITNIGTAHIGTVGSQKNIFKAKMEITSGMSNGCLIVNGEDKYLKKIRNKEVIKVLNKCSNIVFGDSKTTFDLTINGNTQHFTFNIPGKHLLMDVLLAIKVGLLLKVEIKDIITSVSEYKAYEGRMDIIKHNDITIIDDSYNCSYEALIGSLKLLKKDNHNIVILGDMLELGKYSYYFHKKINKELKKLPINEILLIGDYTKVIKGKHFDDIDSLTTYLDSVLTNNSTVLVKGSAKMNLKTIKEYIKRKN